MNLAQTRILRNLFELIWLVTFTTPWKTYQKSPSHWHMARVVRPPILRLFHLFVADVLIGCRVLSS